jgi:myo-inositol-1(or 4)-monophosphatase
MIDLNESLDLAVEISKEAGAILKEMFESAHFGEVVTKASPIDFRTEADEKSQELIIKRIQEKYPGHRFIAEEEGADNLGDPECPYTWIIDPLDGTTCFLHGKPNFGIIIALQENDPFDNAQGGQVVMGVMYLPMTDELYTCIRGKGAFMNGKPLKLRETKNMQDAILCSNTVRRAEKAPDGTLYVSTPYCASLENYGSAVDEFAQMLLGRNDGCFFDGIRLWDVAAGCLMVEELGGKSKYTFKEPGNPRGGLLVVSSTAPIYDELHDFVYNVMTTPVF